MAIGARFPQVLSAAADGADWAWAELYRDLTGRDPRVEPLLVKRGLK